MAIQLESSNMLAVANGVKMSIYGRSGMGKTMLSCTAPAPLIISAERGLLSLKKENIERVWGVNTPGITYELPVIQIETIDDLIEAEAYCRTNPQAQQFQTIIVDSVSEVAEKVLAHAKKGAKDPRQAYGVMLERMLEVIKSFRDLDGKHVVLLFKEERNKDEGTGLTLAGPSVPGQKLGPASPYLTDEVFQLFSGRNPDQSSYRALRTQPDFSADAKDRSGALDEIEFPHIGSVINKILGSQAQPQQ
ncbi:ATPase [Vibrio phage vB_VpS_CA8]|uniref:Uncharacterized protein n=1 Tax=Vibrio phage PH669 TaxID=2800823 RepID=A0A7T7CL92_9CAUD|nr:ATPase [Vibrio phage VspDsh_1]QEA10970.1 ATPase [Vibrio phage vB_VpS_CA8]QEQ95083.1 ATPase [Vibrio phage vB_VpS_BA3]QQK88583.1 hypothetical protein [Vibrio phage PH669]UFK26939.1 ATPase [Vibrio phage vB_VpaS_AL-2]